MSSSRHRFAVIGAGAAGLSAANALLAEGLSVTLYEQKTASGGVWNTTSTCNATPSPVYEGLETNVPRTLMTFSDHPWNIDTPLFPSYRLVNDYLQSYLARIQNSNPGRLATKYLTEVVDIARRTERKTRKWEVKSRLFCNADLEAEFYDGVVVAAGNHQSHGVPPELYQAGLNEWFNTPPGSVMHAAEYRTSEGFTNQNVLVIGNAASGWDISSQVAQVANAIVVSTTRDTQQLSHRRCIGMPPVESFDPQTKSVFFKGGEGFSKPRFRDVDRIICCTGYRNDFHLVTKSITELSNDRISDESLSELLYEFIFYFREPTLAFVGLPKMTAAFTVAEAQSAVVARAFSGRLPLLSIGQMNASIRRNIQQWASMMSAAPYGALPPSQDSKYVNGLFALSMGVTDNSGRSGKPPPFWCGCLDRAREQSRDVRAAYKAKGEERVNFATHISLGFAMSGQCPRHTLPNRALEVMRTCFISD